MNRAVIRGPGDVVVIDAAKPHGSPGQVLVAVGACGLCTLEQRAYRGTARAYPFAPGHEVGGTVLRAPLGRLREGDTVAVSLVPRCGRCAACLSGRDNLCVYLSPFNDPSEGPGGLSECVVADPRDVALVSGQRTVLEAALVEPLACVLNSLRVAGVGTAALALGARATLFETGPAPEGLADAWSGQTRSLKDERAGLSGRDPVLDAARFDSVIVIRGVGENLTVAGQLARPGGRVTVFASPPSEQDIGLASPLLRRKEVSLSAAASHRREDFARAASLVSDGDVLLDDLIHRCFALEQVGAALDYAVERDSARVMVTMKPTAPPGQ
jgi:L-iditol 2-dehydrogenase